MAGIVQKKSVSRERERWKLLRMSAMQSVLPHFQHSSQGLKCFIYVVWR